MEPVHKLLQPSLGGDVNPAEKERKNLYLFLIFKDEHDMQATSMDEARLFESCPK